MYVHVMKPKENKSRAVAYSVAQKKSGQRISCEFINNKAIAKEQQIIQSKMKSNQMICVGDKTTQLAGMNNMPSEMIMEILLNLPPKEVALKRRINKEFKSVIDSVYFMKEYKKKVLARSSANIRDSLESWLDDAIDRNEINDFLEYAHHDSGWV